MLQDIGRKMTWIVAILVVGAIGYGIIAFLSGGEIERKAKNVEQAKDVDSFERVIEKGTLNESIQFIETLVDDPNQPFAVRLEVLQKKIELAQRIVALNEDDKSLQLGQLKSLEARLQKERLLNLNDLSQHWSRENLKIDATDLIDSENQKLVRLADLVLVYVQLFRTNQNTGAVGETSSNAPNALTPSTTSSASTPSKSMDEMLQDLAAKYPEDNYVLTQLAEFADELKRTERVQQADELMRGYARAYRESQDPAIVRLINEAQKRVKRKKYKMRGQGRDIEALRQNVLTKNISHADELIASLKTNPYQEKRYVDLLNCLMLITQSGFIDEARSLVVKTEELFQHSSVQQKQQRRFAEVKTIIDQIGLKFAIADSVSSKLGDKPALILLVSKTRIERFYLRLQKIGEMSQEMAADGVLDVFAVFLDIQNDEDVWSEFEQQVAVYPSIRSIRLSESDTREFLQTYPISWVPTWVLLDDSQRLNQVSPPIPILESMLLELVENSP